MTNSGDGGGTTADPNGTSRYASPLSIMFQYMNGRPCRLSRYMSDRSLAWSKGNEGVISFL